MFLIFEGKDMGGGGKDINDMVGRMDMNSGEDDDILIITTEYT